MKRICVGLIISLLASVALASCVEEVDWGGKVSTLYAVAGIMFSIGMSIVVTSSLAGIRNDETRERIRRALDRVRNMSIIVFLLVSALYMLVSGTSQGCAFGPLRFDYAAFVAMTLALAIVYYIVNFLDIQQLNRKISEALEAI